MQRVLRREEAYLPGEWLAGGTMHREDIWVSLWENPLQFAPNWTLVTYGLRGENQEISFLHPIPWQGSPLTVWHNLTRQVPIQSSHGVTGLVGGFPIFREPVPKCSSLEMHEHWQNCLCFLLGPSRRRWTHHSLPDLFLELSLPSLLWLASTRPSSACLNVAIYVGILFQFPTLPLVILRKASKTNK